MRINVQPPSARAKGDDGGRFHSNEPANHSKLFFELRAGVGANGFDES